MFTHQNFRFRILLAVAQEQFSPLPPKAWYFKEDMAFLVGNVFFQWHFMLRYVSKTKGFSKVVCKLSRIILFR